MKRNIVRIDEGKCNGCGLCVSACHEGALQLIDGKARLISESYCDGLGACLPECPTGAILIEERDADAFDEEAVKQAQATAVTGNAPQAATVPGTLACGCPGTHARAIERKAAPARRSIATAPAASPGAALESELRQWPVQIRLVPVSAPYFDNAHVLVAADCTAYAYAGIHNDFIRNRVTLIGCPKLDDEDYAEKLTAIFKDHEIRSVTVLRMEVPCCGGIASAVKRALVASGKMIPWRIATVATDGSILDE